MLEIVSQLLFLAVFVAMVGFGVYKGNRMITRPALARHRARWEQAAQKLGLGFQDQTGLSRRRYRLWGMRDGRPVEVRFVCEGNGHLNSSLDEDVLQPGRERLEVEVPCRAAMPEGLKVQPEGIGSETLKYLGVQDIRTGDSTLDQRLEFGGRDPAAVTAFFADEGLRSALRLGLGEGGIIIKPGWVVFPLDREAPDAVADLIERAVKVAAAIETAAEAGWARVAGKLGLAQADFDKTGHRPLWGKVEGMPVDVTVPKGAETEVQVQFSSPTPLWLTAPGKAPEDAPPRLELANPVLARLVEARAPSPEAGRILLDDALTEKILAVIGGHPGSRVEPGCVRLVIPGKASPEALEAGIREALALALALQGS